MAYSAEKIFLDQISQDIVHSDLDLEFIIHPTQKNLIPLKEQEAIANALKIIVLTEKGEKPFDPQFGVPFSKLLFNINDLNPLDFEVILRNAINKYEKRVKINNIKYTPYEDENAVDLEIEYTSKALQESFTLNITLRRTK